MLSRYDTNTLARYSFEALHMASRIWWEADGNTLLPVKVIWRREEDLLDIREDPSEKLPLAQRLLSGTPLCIL